MARKDFLESDILEQFESWNDAAQRSRPPIWWNIPFGTTCIAVFAGFSLLASSILIAAFADLWGLSVRRLGRATALAFAVALVAGVSPYVLVIYRSRKLPKINQIPWAALTIASLRIVATVTALS